MAESSATPPSDSPTKQDTPPTELPLEGEPQAGTNPSEPLDKTAAASAGATDLTNKPAAEEAPYAYQSTFEESMGSTPHQPETKPEEPAAPATPATSPPAPPSDNPTEKNTLPTESPLERGPQAGTTPSESLDKTAAASAGASELTNKPAAEEAPYSYESGFEESMGSTPPEPEKKPEEPAAPATPAAPLPSESNKASVPPPPAAKSSTPPPSEPEPEEEQGAETKPFLEHLEDLRWTVIKCMVALFVTTCFSFYALPWIMEALEWPLHGLKGVFDAPPMFIVRDFKDSSALVAKLKGGRDPLSHYLADQFSADSKKLLQEYEPPKWPSKALRDSLVEEFNKIISGENIYTPERFEHVKLRDATRDLIDQKPTGTYLIRLDRFLLEDAYPAEIAPFPGPVDFDAKKFLYTIGPGEVFIFSIKLAVYAGTLMAMPLMLFFIGQFLLPALTRKERGMLWPAFAIGTGLFIIGAAFCFFWIMPRALAVSVQWARWMRVDVNFWRVGEYVGFICGFMLGLGVAFETPLVLLTLVKLGLLSSAALRKGRRYWIIFSLVAGSLLTTPEIYTQIVMAIVLCVLYEISIIGAKLIERRAAVRA